MNSTIETILKRNSVRSYDARPIEAEVKDEILPPQRMHFRQPCGYFGGSGLSERNYEVRAKTRLDQRRYGLDNLLDLLGFGTVDYIVK